MDRSDRGRRPCPLVTHDSDFADLEGLLYHQRPPGAIEPAPSCDLQDVGRSVGSTQRPDSGAPLPSAPAPPPAAVWCNPASRQALNSPCACAQFLHSPGSRRGVSLVHSRRAQSRHPLPVRPACCPEPADRAAAAGAAFAHARPVVLDEGHAREALHQLAAGPAVELPRAPGLPRQDRRAAHRSGPAWPRWPC